MASSLQSKIKAYWDRQKVFYIHIVSKVGSQKWYSFVAKTLQQRTSILKSILHESSNKFKVFCLLYDCTLATVFELDTVSILSEAKWPMQAWTEQRANFSYLHFANVIRSMTTYFERFTRWFEASISFCVYCASFVGLIQKFGATQLVGIMN